MRKFELRNGAIIIESPTGITVTDSDNFIDDYKVIDYGDMCKEKAKEVKESNDYICLLVHKGGFPSGGSFGELFDIVKEVVE